MVLTDDIKAKFKGLTKKEIQYFKQMWPKSGVLYITSKPSRKLNIKSRKLID